MRNGIGSITKLAVVGALILVGAVGMGWAQTSPIQSWGIQQTVANNTGSMSILYEVLPLSSKVNFQSNSGGAANSGNELLAYKVGTTTPNNEGNTGTITVTPGHEFWDIELRTANNGLLRLGGAGTGAILKKRLSDGTTMENCSLGVEIGIISDEDDVAKLVDSVKKVWLRKSKDSPIGFANIITDKFTAYAMNDTSGVSKSLGGRPLLGQGNEYSIKKQGFAIPKNYNKTIKFIVNTGLGGISADDVKGNAAGKYLDTLKFTFIASN